MSDPDDIMLKRKPEANPLHPEPEVPEGALESEGAKVPPVLPYVKVGKEIYGRHTAIEVGVKGEF
jgi:hypothetical protein